MKNVSYLFIRTCIILIFAASFVSCKRDGQVKRVFKATLKTWYRVSPTPPNAVMVGGTSYVSLANLAVTGDGTASFIGKVDSYANVLSYSTAPDGVPLGAIGAPVNEIPGYPVLGAPLPLLQAGDFAALPGVISALDIPISVGGNMVNFVMFDKAGNAIFLSSIPGTGTSLPLSPTSGGYTNKVLIVGGTGKFKDARGELSNSGYFSFIDPYHGEDNYEGWILF